MGQSLKAILQLALIVAVLVFLIAFGERGMLAWKMWIGSGAVIVVASTLLIRSATRKEILPDMLGKIARRYFERDGLCFTFVPTAVDGICWMQIFFQNRYERMCQARIVLQPPRKFIGRVAVAGIDIDITCDGAAFGMCRVPWPIAAKQQGRLLKKFEVGCDTTYPGGAGKLLRFREGLRAGAAGARGIKRAAAIAGAAASGGLLLVGVISISRPATLSIRLPKGVAEEIPPGYEPSLKILWEPDLPTGGFPVTPVEPPAPTA